MDEWQDLFSSAWEDDMSNLHISFNDATAYESYIKYPTDVGLLWDCCKWVNEQLRRFVNASINAYLEISLLNMLKAKRFMIS